MVIGLRIYLSCTKLTSAFGDKVRCLFCFCVSHVSVTQRAGMYSSFCGTCDLLE